MAQDSTQENYYNADQSLFKQDTNFVLSQYEHLAYQQDLSSGPVIHKGEVAENRKTLLAIALSKIAFNPSVVSKMAEDILAGRKASVTSFTHFPDIVHALMSQHLIQQGITNQQLESSFKVVGGDPIDGQPNNPTHGKMEHIIAAQLASGKNPISVTGASLTDDSPRNIAQAWQYGMETVWVDPQGQLCPNVLPVPYKDKEGKEQIWRLTIKDDKSIDRLQEGTTSDMLDALGALTSFGDIDIDSTVKPSKTPEDLDFIIAKVMSNQERKDQEHKLQAQQHGVTSIASPPEPNLCPQWRGRDIKQALETRESRNEFVSYAVQYRNAARNDLENRAANPTMPGVEPTPHVIDRTLAFMVHLGGNKESLEKLELQTTELAKGLNAVPPKTKEPKFQQEYANFCAEAHQHVAAYHALQENRFRALVEIDKQPGGSLYWQECAHVAANLKEQSLKDAEINRSIGKAFGQKLGVSQQAPSPDNARRLAHEMRDALGAQSTTTGRPMVVADPVQSAQSKAAKPKVVRRHSI
jgi:hypothetical protein